MSDPPTSSAEAPSEIPGTSQFTTILETSPAPEETATTSADATDIETTTLFETTATTPATETETSVFESTTVFTETSYLPSTTYSTSDFESFTTTTHWQSTTDWPVSPSTTLASPTVSPTPLPPAEEALYDAWALLILLGLLLVTLFAAYGLKRWRVKYVHETVLSVVLGLVVGLVIRVAPGDTIQHLVLFDQRIFFNVLLPPILLNSGYEMKMNMFFKNLGTILTFAFLGTLTSSIVVAVFIYLFVLTGIHRLALSFLDCFILGAILSSTDPVTVLAVFHQLKVDAKLYAIIFGESVLNDSVAIVLFSTLDTFRSSSLSFGTLAQGTGLFMAVFTGSVLIGLVIGLLSALLFKHSRIYLYPPLESCILTLLAYCSYLLANALQLSGIVTLLFCGIAMRHYAYPNLAAQGRRTTRYMFRVLATMSENFIFVSLGITVFAGKDAYLPGLIIYTVLVLLFARWVSVIPFAQLINRISAAGSIRLPPSPTTPAPSRSILASIFSASPTSPTTFGGPREPIPKNYQQMMVIAGLRGAIAFALAYQLSAPEEATEAAMRSTTLAVCVVSVLMLGSLVMPAISYFGIRTGVEDGGGGDSSDEDEPGYNVRSGTGGDNDEDEALMAGESGQPGRKKHWFVDFDERWLQPFFRVRFKRDGHEGDGELVTDAMPDRVVSPTSNSGSRRRFGRADANNGAPAAGAATAGSTVGTRVTVTAAPPPPRNRRPPAAADDGDEEFVDASGNAWGRQATRANSVGTEASVKRTSADDPLFPLPPQSSGTTLSRTNGKGATKPATSTDSSEPFVSSAPRLLGGIIDLTPKTAKGGSNPLAGTSMTPDSDASPAGGWARARDNEDEGYGLFQTAEDLRSNNRGSTFGGLGDL